MATPVSSSPPAPVAPPRTTRRGRLRKWDRPPEPRDWRFFVGGLGKVLIAVGLLMFGFVGYQLWGTAIETAAAQNELETEFDALLAQVDPVASVDVFDTDASMPAPAEEDAPDAPVDDGSAAEADPDTPLPTTDADEGALDALPDPAPAAAAVPAADQNIPLLENGDALARIEIPAIGVNDIVVAGVDTGDLKKGPGHFPDTPLPGQLGNAAIAGHRTTYGSPFFDVDDLVPGDEIRLTTLSGVFVYRVTGLQIVQPSNYEVVSTTDSTRANLTLTSCHPKFTARERIVVFSELDATASAPVGEPVLNYGRVDEDPSAADAVLPGDPDLDQGTDPIIRADGDDTNTVDSDASSSASGNLDDALLDDATDATDQLNSTQVNNSIADAFSESWFSDPDANPQVGIWGLAVSAVALAGYALSRRFRNDLVGLAIGIAPFVVTLYFFFQNVNRLLPPHL